MKQLIIFRHGNYLGGLLREAKLGLELIARDIKPRLVGGNVQIISSPVARATASAEIVSAELGIGGFETDEILWTGNDSPRKYVPDIDGTIQLIREVRADVLILVTHFEYASDLPDAFARSVLGRTAAYPETTELLKGQAWLIDCVSGTRERLVPQYSR